MSAFKSILRKTLGASVRLPAEMWKHFAESASSAPYLVSCLSNPAVLYVSPKFRDLTGYACGKFVAGGASFWFSVIHPADMQTVVSSITRAQADLWESTAPPTVPLKLEYRITRRDGRIVWIREFKQIVSYRDGKKDHVLGCLHDITVEKAAQDNAVQAVLKRNRACNGLLEVAVSYQLKDVPERGATASKNPGRVTLREREVLRLVAAGSSSKQIAAELGISENTVETHRRHLLQKFNVSNSTALVKQAHRHCLV